MFIYLNVQYVSKYELILFVWMGNKILSHEIDGKEIYLQECIST